MNATKVVETLRAALSDRYRLERELGAGGMATVYLAHDLKHERQVAIKVLHQDLAAALGAERFLAEIKTTAKLQHPHILPLLDSGEAAGLLYYVMPYVDGETLRDRLARSGEMPVHEAVRLLLEIGEALAHAHSRGVVHRDIKPENVMLSGRHAMVVDFGIAKAVTEATGRQQLTTAGVALGTPAYMAPEQATADPQLDGRVDIYALGVLAYEMLTGQPPFVGLSPQQTLAAHLTTTPALVSQRRPSITAPLEAVVMRCLEKRPADRFQRAEEVVSALEPLATPSGGTTPLSPVRTARWNRPAVRRGAVAIIALAAAIAAWQALVSRRGIGGRQGPAVGVAVLSLRAEGDTSQEYLAQGISERVSDALGGVRGLRVKSWTAVRRVQQANRDNLPEIGRVLGVPNLIEGSLRRVGGRVQLQVRLVNAEDEAVRWAQSFEGDSLEVPRLPIAIAQALIPHLRPQLAASEEESLRSRVLTTNAAAYNAYLRGNFEFASRTLDGIQRALAAYQSASEADPAFAEAKARVSMSYLMLLDYWWIPKGLTAEELRWRAVAYADSAMAMKVESADAQLSQCYLRLLEYWYFDGRRLPEARQYCARAVALDPSSAEAVFRSGHIELMLDNVDAAQGFYLKASAMDPRWHVPFMGRAWALYSHGEARRACVLLDSASRLAPEYLWARQFRGQCRLMIGDTSTTRTEIVELRALGDSVGVAFVQGLLAAHRGDRAGAHNEATRLKRYTPDWVSAAQVEAVAGNRDEALRLLETTPYAIATYLRFQEFDTIRGEPRFRAIFDREVRRARGEAP
jgi:serine/threonine-protein kinase